MAFVPIDHTVNFAEDKLALASDMQTLDQNIDSLYAAQVGDPPAYTLSTDGHYHNETDGKAAALIGHPVYSVFSEFSGAKQFSYVGPASGGDTGFVTVATYDGWIQAGSDNFIMRADVTGILGNGIEARLQLIGTGSTDTSNVISDPTTDAVFTLPISEDNWDNLGTVQLQIRHETPVSTSPTYVTLAGDNIFYSHFN